MVFYVVSRGDYTSFHGHPGVYKDGRPHHNYMSCIAMARATGLTPAAVAELKARASALADAPGGDEQVISARQVVLILKPEIVRMRRSLGMEWKAIATWLAENSGVTLKAKTLKEYVRCARESPSGRNARHCVRRLEDSDRPDAAVNGPVAPSAAVYTDDNGPRPTRARLLP